MEQACTVIVSVIFAYRLAVSKTVRCHRFHQSDRCIRGERAADLLLHVEKLQKMKQKLFLCNSEF